MKSNMLWFYTLEYYKPDTRWVGKLRLQPCSPIGAAEVSGSVFKGNVTGKSIVSGAPEGGVRIQMFTGVNHRKKV